MLALSLVSRSVVIANSKEEYWSSVIEELSGKCRKTIHQYIITLIDCDVTCMLFYKCSIAAEAICIQKGKSENNMPNDITKK
jgi:hypothetical protein